MQASSSPCNPSKPSSHKAARPCVCVCVRGLKCRAEVMGSSRKGRSRVHGGVKEREGVHGSCLLSCFLPTGGRRPRPAPAPRVTAPAPRVTAPAICFSAFLKSSPGRNTARITTSLVSLALCVPLCLYRSTLDSIYSLKESSANGLFSSHLELSRLCFSFILICLLFGSSIYSFPHQIDVSVNFAVIVQMPLMPIFFCSKTKKSTDSEVNNHRNRDDVIIMAEIVILFVYFFVEHVGFPLM